MNITISILTIIFGFGTTIGTIYLGFQTKKLVIQTNKIKAIRNII